MNALKKQDTNDLWLLALHETGREIFEREGLPSPADEDWKFSSLRPYARADFQITLVHPQVTKDDLPERLFETRIVFVNGMYSYDLSDTVVGLDIVNLADQPADVISDNVLDLGDLAQKPLKAFNTAHFRDGVALVLNNNQVCDAPIEILYYSTDAGLQLKPQIFSRNVFILGDSAQLEIIENHQGHGRYAAHHVTDITLGQDAAFKHYRLQNDTTSAYHFAHTRLMQHQFSTYETMTLTVGSAFSRHDIECQLIASDVTCILKGCAILGGAQHSDTKILVDHMEPNGVSNQLYKGIYNDESRSVFQGKIHVRRAAQGTDGRQLNNALLLSTQAEVDAKPELEIYADDVECAHGCTVGALDDAPLFYMRSRGIPEERAKRLLMRSFLFDTTKDIENDDMRALFEGQIDRAIANVGDSK